MCPPSDETPGDQENGPPGHEAGFDQHAMYEVVRAAVKDAMLDVIGTVLLVGIAMVLLWAGGGIILAGGGSPGSVLVGLPVVAVAVYVAGSAVDLIPSIWELL